MKPEKQTAEVAASREQKRARFEQPESTLSKLRFPILAGVVAIAIIAGILFESGMFGGTEGDAKPRIDPHATKAAQSATAGGPSGASVANATVINAEGDAFRLPAESISTQASFFKAGPVPFFAVRDASGQVHIALDACQSCAAAKKGYVQVGDGMQCKKCGELFPITNITKMGGRGGCHPISLPWAKQGNSLVIKREDIDAGAKYF